MTRRLLSIAHYNWATFDGYCASKNTDPLSLPIDRMLSLLYFFAVRNGDPDSIAKFDRDLWMPPRGEVATPGSPWSPEAENAALADLASATGQSG